MLRDVGEGLRRIRVFWPEAMFKMLDESRLAEMHVKLRQLADGPAPEDLRELIRRMDTVGLGLQGSQVVHSGGWS
jgi:hypothetical protein